MKYLRWVLWAAVFIALAMIYFTLPDAETVDSLGDQDLANGESRASGLAKDESPLAGRQVVPFKLTERSGEEFDSEDLEDQVWIASFFFTSCPADCIKLNTAIADLDAQLADLPLTFVSITVHPEYDTPERLRPYAERFGADPQRWLFLTGPMDEIRHLANESFLVSAEPRTHSVRMFLIDKNGQVQGMYSASEERELEELKQKIDELLEGTT